MGKKETIKAIEDGREAHLEQMDSIKLLVEGKQLEEYPPVLKTKCSLGRFLYGDQESMKNILGVQFYSNLDMIHEAWHMQYAKIHAIFMNEKGGGLFSKLFKSQKVDDLEIEKAKVYYTELEKITQELLKTLDVSQRRLQALCESKFE